MRNCSIILFFFLICIPIIAQNMGSRTKGCIEGSIYDKSTKETIIGASIKLLQEKDSSYVLGTATNTNGCFKINTQKGKYIVEISFIGYETSHRKIKLESDSSNYNLGNIYLEENAIQLREAEITAQIPPIVNKGDTIEYNAGAYSVEESSVLQDLLKKIPGIEVDANGNITVNGKSIQKILVDGKEFFGNDIALALDNLPANMIKKLQLFKEDSETAKVTGIKDKDPQQVINLVVKDELKESLFGNVTLGYGSDDRYDNKGIVNYMQNENQISLVGKMSNISEHDPFFGNNGIDKNKNMGLNVYRQTSDNLKIGGSVRYTNNDNLLETKTNTQTFLSSGDRYSKQQQSNQNIQQNFNIGGNIQWTPDSLTTIYARSYISFNENKSWNNSSSLSYVSHQDTTSGFSNTYNNSNGYTLNTSITAGRKLNDKGRSISFTLYATSRNSDGTNTNYSETNYSSNTPTKIINQKSNIKNDYSTYSLNLSYVEPINKTDLLQVTYTINQNSADRNRDTKRIDADGNYTIPDSAYTRDTHSKYMMQSVGLNYQSSKEKYYYSLGFNIEPTNSKSKVLLGDSIIEELKQYVVNYAPSFQLSYTPDSNTNLFISYSGMTSQPGVSQLSADTTIVNALTKVYGNPDLKPSFSNDFNFNFQRSDYESARFLLISGSFRYVNNNIVDYTTIDKNGNIENTYRNVSGDMNLNLSFMYETPFKNKKFSINTNTYSNYYKNIGFTNGEKAITNNIVLSEKITAKFKSDLVQTDLKVGITYNTARNNLRQESNRNTTNYSVANETNIKLPYDITFNNTIEYSYKTGYENDFKKSQCIWNVSLSKLLLKKKNGILKIEASDLLNDRNALSRMVDSNYISDTYTNSISRYILISFTYRFSIAKGKSVEDEYEDEYQ